MTDDLIFIMKLYAYTQKTMKVFIASKRQPTKVTVFH